MAKINCNNCTACCRWGDDAGIRVRLTEKDLLMGHSGVALPNGSVVIATDGKGNCMHLDKKNHLCKIHDRAPEACQKFDCRDVLAEVASSNYPLTNVLISAIYMNKRDMIDGYLMRIVGWMYADACTSIDRDEDYRKVEVPALVSRLKSELGIE